MISKKYSFAEALKQYQLNIAQMKLIYVIGNYGFKIEGPFCFF